MKVNVTHDHVVHATPSVNVLYRAGSTVVAPHAHIDEIVAAGHGERISVEADREPPAPAQDEEPSA